MKTRPFALLAPLLLAAAPMLAQAPNDSPEAVVRAFHAALAAGDSARALDLLLADVVIYEAGGVEASRDQYRAQHLPADMAFSAATRSEVTNQRTGVSGDIAWVLTESRTTGAFRDRPIDSVGVETMILKRTPAGWRIAHIHWSSRRGS